MNNKEKARLTRILIEEDVRVLKWKEIRTAISNNKNLLSNPSEVHKLISHVAEELGFHKEFKKFQEINRAKELHGKLGNIVEIEPANPNVKVGDIVRFCDKRFRYKGMGVVEKIFLKGTIMSMEEVRKYCQIDETHKNWSHFLKGRAKVDRIVIRDPRSDSYMIIPNNKSTFEIEEIHD